MDEPREVLLISPPWCEQRSASLAVGTLAPILRSAGIPTRELHGSVLLSAGSTRIFENMSSFLFVPCVYPEVDRARLARRALEHFVLQAAMGRLRARTRESVLAEIHRRLGLDEAGLLRRLLLEMDHAEEVMARCVALADRPEHDVIGFSVTFETQIHAAVALATRLEALAPERRFIAGGAACLARQGQGLARSFPVFDAVCHGEGEQVVVPLVRALRDGGDLSRVPGICFRAADGSVQTTGDAPALRDLDALPIPDYDAFVQQLGASATPRSTGDTRILFETSRGCSWAERQKCTFCGLEDTSAQYRHKSAARVEAEIARLHAGYPGSLLVACDHVLTPGLLSKALRRLEPLASAPERPLRMFFETRTRLRRDELDALSRSGLVVVQAGVESFCDEILAGMNKGARALDQIQFLKWACEARVNVVYLMIVMSPGDLPEWYDEMTALVPWLEHLPPPASVVPMELYRFSECHRDPERFGIRRVRPSSWYADLFPDPAVDVDSIAYVFDFEHAIYEDETLMDAVRRFAEVVRTWRDHWRPLMAFAEDDGRALAVHDQRAYPARRYLLAGRGAEVLRSMGRHRPRSAIYRELPGLDPAAIDAALSTFRHRRWTVRIRDRWLATLPARHSRPGDARAGGGPSDAQGSSGA